MKLLTLLLFILMTSACEMSVRLSSLDIPKDLRPPQKPSPSPESFIGNRTLTSTENNYKVDSSIGEILPKVQQTTEDQYKVYISAQGVIFSESL